jgi:predicted nucleotidyltransferase
MTSPLLPIEREALEAFCRRHHIQRLAVFGSALKGSARPDSDIDLLVAFEADHVPGLLAIASMEMELSALVGGRKIDIRTASDLSRHFRDEVVRTAHVEYAA